MSWWEALVLGVVQGLTEFFPVSSSGHLVITEDLLGLRLPGVAFDVALHVATLLSVILVYRHRLTDLVLGVLRPGNGKSWRYIGLLVLATIPAAIVGFAFEDWFEARFDDPVLAGTMILVTGSFVWSSRWALRGGARRPLEWAPVVVAGVVALIAGTALPFIAVLAVEAALMAFARATAGPDPRAEPDTMGALLMGVAQCVAILPGVSRSGSTVMTGLWRRIDPAAAAEFSFLMAIPAILGAAILQLPDLRTEGASVSTGAIVIGGVAAAVAGVLAIRFFVAMLRQRSFHVFAYYCWLAGGLYVLLR